MSNQLVTSVRKQKHEYRALTIVGGTSLNVVLPKQFASDLGLGRGDYVKVSIDGKRIILEKAA